MTIDLGLILQGVSQIFKSHHILIKLGILQPSTPFLPLLPAVLRRDIFLNNQCPTLAETHLPGQLAKSNDRKITCEMKQPLPLPVKCLYNKSLNEALI